MRDNFDDIEILDDFDDLTQEYKTDKLTNTEINSTKENQDEEIFDYSFDFDDSTNSNSNMNDILKNDFELDNIGIIEDDSPKQVSNFKTEDFKNVVNKEEISNANDSDVFKFREDNDEMKKEVEDTVSFKAPLLDPSLSIGLNKEEAMEEALSHTTRFSPFQEEKIKEEPYEDNKVSGKRNQKGVAFIVILFVLLMVFVLLLPTITEMLG